jgi:hypothetical protein
MGILFAGLDCCVNRVAPGGACKLPGYTAVQHYYIGAHGNYANMPANIARTLVMPRKFIVTARVDGKHANAVGTVIRVFLLCIVPTVGHVLTH